MNKIDSSVRKFLHSPSKAFLPSMVFALAGLNSPNVLANLVTDPSFELDSPAWVFQGAGAGRTTTGGDALGTGIWSGYINPFSSNPSISQDIGTIPGHSYLVDFWLSQNGFTNIYNASVSFGNTVGYSFDNSTNPVSLPWTEYSFTATAALASETFSLLGQIDGGTIFLDQVSITDITEPSSVPVPATVWLFGSGLVSLGVIRKRKQAVLR